MVEEPGVCWLSWSMLSALASGLSCIRMPLDKPGEGVGLDFRPIASAVSSLDALAMAFPLHASEKRRQHATTMLLAGLLILLALESAPEVADVAVDPSAPWYDRVNPCVMEWDKATPAQQGTMSYRQFISKCVGGQTALPFKTRAICHDNSSSAGDAPGGACAQKWRRPEVA